MNPGNRPYQSTSFEPFDLDHDRIWHGLERLLDAVNGNKPKDAVTIFGSVTDQFIAHFAAEEQLMADTGYPLAARHKEAHDTFLLDLKAAHAGLAGGKISPTFRRWATGRALAWVRLHITTNDVGLGQFLEARDRAGPRVVEPSGRR